MLDNCKVIDFTARETEGGVCFVPEFNISFHIVGQYVALRGMRTHKSKNVNFSCACNMS